MTGKQAAGAAGMGVVMTGMYALPAVVLGLLTGGPGATIPLAVGAAHARKVFGGPSQPTLRLHERKRHPSFIARVEPERPAQPYRPTYVVGR